MKKPLAMVLLALIVFLAGCAPGTLTYPRYIEKPGGPGTVPPSWYDYDPALRGWYEPWYVNPYLQ